MFARIAHHSGDIPEDLHTLRGRMPCLDLHLAHHYHSEDQHRSFSVFATKLRDLTKATEDLEVARDVASNMDQLVAYLSITLDQTNPLLQGLVTRRDETRKSVEELVRC